MQVHRTLLSVSPRTRSFNNVLSNWFAKPCVRCQDPGGSWDQRLTVSLDYFLSSFCMYKGSSDLGLRKGQAVIYLVEGMTFLICSFFWSPTVRCVRSTGHRRAHELHTRKGLMFNMMIRKMGMWGQIAGAQIPDFLVSSL